MVKKNLFIGVFIVVLIFKTITYAAESELTLDTSDSGSGFTVKDSLGNTIFRAVGDSKIGVGTSNPTEKLEIGGTPGVDGIKFPDGTTQTTAAIQLVINDTQPNARSETAFTAASLFTLDFDEVPGTQIRLIFRGSVTGPTATQAFYRLTTNQSWPINPLEIPGSIVSTTSSTPSFIDTGWISYTKPTGIAILAIQARVDATAGTFVDFANLTGATIWFK